MKVNEIFKSIQGEGRYAGTPMLFIRLYDCTRRCDYCDTLYAVEGNNYKTMTVDKLVNIIKKSKIKHICWTGGEPLLQIEEILQVMRKAHRYFFHLETNGDLINSIKKNYSLFHYIAISPKTAKIAQKIRAGGWFLGDQSDIKIVTDLKTVGKTMVKYATLIMPLTTYKKKKDLEIQRDVWNYCIKHNKKFTPRYQYWIWGNQKGI